MNPQTQAHFECYEHNVALSKRIEANLAEDSDWACVVLFYAAMHLLNAYLINKQNIQFDPNSTDHSARRRAIEKCPELSAPSRRYRQLKELSEHVRYDPGFVFTPEHLADAKTHFARFQAIVLPKVKSIMGS